MGAVIISVQRTGFSDASKTFTVADADIDKIVTAYQGAANTSINGTATRNQVLLYWAQQIAAMTQNYVQAQNVTPAIVPAPIGMT